MGWGGVVVLPVGFMTEFRSSPAFLSTSHPMISSLSNPQPREPR